MLQILLGYPRAGIRKGDPQIILRRRSLYRDRSLCRGLQSVLEYVDQRLPHLGSIYPGGRKGIRIAAMHRCTPLFRLRLEEPHNFLQHSTHIHVGPLQVRGPGEDQKLLHQVLQSQHLLLDHLHRLQQILSSFRRPFRDPSLHQQQLDLHRVERISDLVGQSGCKASRRRQSLGSRQIPLQPPALSLRRFDPTHQTAGDDPHGHRNNAAPRGEYPDRRVPGFTYSRKRLLFILFDRDPQGEVLQPIVRTQHAPSPVILLSLQHDSSSLLRARALGSTCGTGKTLLRKIGALLVYQSHLPGLPEVHVFDQGIQTS